MYELLVPHLYRGGTIRLDYAVAIFHKGENSTVALYSDDKTAIKQIMSEATKKVFPAQDARFKELLSKYPIVPD